LSRKDIMRKFYEVYGRAVQDEILRREILPNLETAGLIIQESNPNDKREVLTYVITPQSNPLYLKSDPQSNSISKYIGGNSVGKK
jgi:hypothetical protein